MGGFEVRTRRLRVTYGSATAVAGVDIDLAPGVVHAVVGPNGAGKSSLMLALAGAVPAEGEVMLGDRSINDLSVAERAKAGIALVPQGRQIFPTLTVRENLEVMAEVLDVGPPAVETALDRFPILRDRESAYAGVMSGGEQQMLSVSRALMGPADVLLLDEMATGLAPVIVQQLGRAVRELAAGGATVVMATPSLAGVTRYVDRGIVMLRGEVVGEAVGGEQLDRLYQQKMGIPAPDLGGASG